jgi:hypothetical protein
MHLRTASVPKLCGMVVFAVAMSGALGCTKERWHVQERMRARDADVAAALGDTVHQSSTGLAASDIPAINYPRSLRPCCAFGADYKVQVGRIPVPGVEIGNLLGPEDVGRHRYDNGFISINTSDPRGYIDSENNGLIYTCRGGFIDLAHVRDNADNTMALAASIARTMDNGGVIEVPPQGASMRLRVRAIPPAAIEKYDRVRLSTAMAQWAAYQFSIWHEIATFYGYSSLAEWPEKISAFSPEDYYSNQIGIRIAGGVILGKGARSDIEYAANMDAWIKRTLDRLIAVPLKDSRAAMRAVDGAWWDSEKRIPDWTLVKRRHFQPGPELAPWRLEEASPGAKGPVSSLSRCRDVDPPLVFHIPEGFSGAPYRDYMTVEFEVEDVLAKEGFPFPRADSRLVTQDDFPSIIEAARSSTLEQLGAGADQP